MPGPGAFRLLLALIVVLHHNTPLRLGGWAVDVFFVLSGYWIARIWEERYQHTRMPVFTFLVSRWWRLAPVLMSCLLLMIIVHAAGGRPLAEVNALWILRQFPIVGSTFEQRILPPQWSLDVEMQFYCVAALMFPFLFRARNLQRSHWLGLGAGVCWAASVIYLILGGSPDSPHLPPWLGFFLIGVWLWRSHWLPSKTCAMAGTGAFFLVTASLIAYHQTRSGVFVAGISAPSRHFANWPDAWQDAGALLMTPFLAWNVRATTTLSFDRLLGNWAYPLYVFHWLPREWYYRNVNWTLPWQRNALLLLMDLTVALAGSFVILWLIDRPLDRLRSRWVKRRCLPRPGERPASSVCAPGLSSPVFDSPPS